MTTIPSGIIEIPYRLTKALYTSPINKIEFFMRKSTRLCSRAFHQNFGQPEVFGGRNLNILIASLNDFHPHAEAFNEACLIGALVAVALRLEKRLTEQEMVKDLGGLGEPDAFPHWG